MEPESSWILVKFISTEPQQKIWELFFNRFRVPSLQDVVVLEIYHMVRCIQLLLYYELKND